MFGLDLHGWEAVVVWSLGVAAAAALAVVVSTRIVIILQRGALKDSDERIALASERAALAEARAAEANLELAKLKEHMAGRVVTPEMREKLKPLANTGTGIAVTWVRDAEAAIFGAQLADALAALRLIVRRPPSPPDSNGAGTVVVFPESMDEYRKKALADIFLAAGIPDRSSRPWALDEVHAEDVVIFVGEKMPVYPK